MKTKKCTKCGTEKPLTAEYYHRDKTTSTGFVSHCKFCRNERLSRSDVKEKKAKYYQDNKEKIAKRQAKYYQDNKEKIAKRQAKYYQDNKEKIAKRETKYYHDNKEKIAKRQAKYRKNNKEKIANYRIEYRKNNKEKITKQKIDYRSRPEVKKAIAKREAKYYQDNKERIMKYRAQRTADQPGCVYQIVNCVNNKIYIGETIRGELRWKAHLSTLRGNYHDNVKLQKDFNKFGDQVTYE